MNFTKGPWHANSGIVFADNGGSRVCTVAYQNDEAEAKANATLIEAAPELYEAVRDAEAVLDATIELGLATDAVHACHHNLTTLLARLEEK